MAFINLLLLNKYFADTYKLDSQNSFIYNNSNFYNVMYEAILLNNHDYKKKQYNLIKLSNNIYNNSYQNLNITLNSIIKYKL